MPLWIAKKITPNTLINNIPLFDNPPFEPDSFDCQVLSCYTKVKAIKREDREESKRHEEIIWLR